MHIITGNLWDELGVADLVLFTGNSTLDGRLKRLVMGAGAAKEAANLFPGLSLALGEVLKSRGLVGGFYGVIQGRSKHRDGNLHRVGAFQTKTNWREYSPIGLIEDSARVLAKMAPVFGRIALNMPGCGFGGLTEGEVLPRIEFLPDNVFIYRK